VALAVEKRRCLEHEAKLKAQEEIQKQENILEAAKQEAAAQLRITVQELAQ
jgi:hypothetical protein